MKKTDATKKVDVPAELAEALEKNTAAKARFLAMPPSHRRQYSGFITEAKREETRRRRAEKAIEMLLTDKPSKA